MHPSPAEIAGFGMAPKKWNEFDTARDHQFRIASTYCLIASTNLSDKGQRFTSAPSVTSSCSYATNCLSDPTMKVDSTGTAFKVGLHIPADSRIDCTHPIVEFIRQFCVLRRFKNGLAKFVTPAGLDSVSNVRRHRFTHELISRC